jgi:hypothetical protein
VIHRGSVGEDATRFALVRRRPEKKTRRSFFEQASSPGRIEPAHTGVGRCFESVRVSNSIRLLNAVGARVAAGRARRRRAALSPRPRVPSRWTRRETGRAPIAAARASRRGAIPRCCPILGGDADTARPVDRARDAREGEENAWKGPWTHSLGPQQPMMRVRGRRDETVVRSLAVVRGREDDARVLTTSGNKSESVTVYFWFVRKCHLSEYGNILRHDR